MPHLWTFLTKKTEIFMSKHYLPRQPNTLPSGVRLAREIS